MYTFIFNAFRNRIREIKGIRKLNIEMKESIALHSPIHRHNINIILPSTENKRISYGKRNKYTG